MPPKNASAAASAGPKEKRQKISHPPGYKRSRFMAGLHSVTHAFIRPQKEPEQPLAPVMLEKGPSSQGRMKRALGCRVFVTGDLYDGKNIVKSINCEHAMGREEDDDSAQQEVYHPLLKDMSADRSVDLIKGNGGRWIVKRGLVPQPEHYLGADDLNDLKLDRGARGAKKTFQLGERECCMGSVVRGGSAARTVKVVVERVTKPEGTAYHVVKSDLSVGPALQLLLAGGLDPFQHDCMLRISRDNPRPELRIAAMAAMSAGLKSEAAVLLAKDLEPLLPPLPPAIADNADQPDVAAGRSEVFARAGAAYGAAMQAGLSKAQAMAAAEAVLSSGTPHDAADADVRPAQPAAPALPNAAAPSGALSVTKRNAVDQAMTLVTELRAEAQQAIDARDRGQDGPLVSAIHAADRALYVDRTAKTEAEALGVAKRAAQERLKAAQRVMQQRLQETQWAAEEREKEAFAINSNLVAQPSRGRTGGLERQGGEVIEIQSLKADLDRLQTEAAQATQNIDGLRELLRASEEAEASGQAGRERDAAVRALMRARQTEPADSRAGLAVAKAAALMARDNPTCSDALIARVADTVFVAHRLSGSERQASLAGSLMARYFERFPETSGDDPGEGARAAQAAIAMGASVDDATQPDWLAARAGIAASAQQTGVEDASLAAIVAVMRETRTARVPDLPDTAADPTILFTVPPGANAGDEQEIVQATAFEKTVSGVPVPEHYEVVGTSAEPHLAVHVEGHEFIPLRTQTVVLRHKHKYREQHVTQQHYMIQVEYRDKKVWCDYDPGTRLRDTCGEITICSRDQPADCGAAKISVGFNGITGKWESLEDRENILRIAQAKARDALRKMVSANDVAGTLFLHGFHAENSVIVKQELANQNVQMSVHVENWVRGRVSRGRFISDLAADFDRLAKTINSERSRKKLQSRKMAMDIAIVIGSTLGVAAAMGRLGIVA